MDQSICWLCGTLSCPFLFCLAVALVRRFFMAPKKAEREYLEKPDCKRRLVLSEQILRLYNERNEQIAAIHWNNNINVVEINEAVLICYGKYRCLAAISRQMLEEQGGAEPLRQAVQRFQENASPITETMWKALLIPRPNLIWGASYSLKEFFKKQIQKRTVLFIVLVGAMYWLMFGFEPVTLVVLLIVTTVFGLRMLMLKKNAEKNARKQGAPMGVKEIPARFELYEEGIQISRGEEGSFWEWKDINSLPITKNELLLKKGKGIITAVPNQAFAAQEEKQRIVDFLQEHINAAHKA